jgi:acyl-CoA dehydrogenase
VTDDFPLAYFYKIARTLRIVDGPDEVHRFQLGRMELAKHKQAAARPEAAARAAE